MTNRKPNTIVYEGEALRADKALAAALGISRSAAARLLEEGAVLRNGQTPDKKDLIPPGAELTVFLPAEEETAIRASEIPLDIVYEDDALLVVNKPAGMVVHPAPGNTEGTLCHALLHHCGPELARVGAPGRPGIVHRLDKDTGGLLMVAKTPEAFRDLAAQIKVHSFLREYEAAVYGRVKADEGTVDAPVGRHPVRRKKMAVLPDGKPAVTHFRVLAHYREYTHLRLRLETGRTHQIRVHMAHIGHPVAGDPLYAGRRTAPGLTAQCLFAKKIGFRHPATGEYMEFEVPLPERFTRFLARLGPPE